MTCATPSPQVAHPVAQWRKNGCATTPHTPQGGGGALRAATPPPHACGWAVVQQRRETIFANEGKMIVIGIDPGSASGACAWVSTDGRAAVADLPLVAGSLDPHHLSAILLDTPEPAAAVFCELVGVMPKQGISSGFKFGRAVGAIHATVALVGLRLELVTPTTWKRHHHLGPDKEKARALAIRRWPALAARLARKKDADRAEALLIADYGLHDLGIGAVPIWELAGVMG